MHIIEFIKSFPLKRFDKDEIIIGADETTSSVYIIREGFVKVSSLDELGRQKLLWIAGRYDVVPGENLFNHSPTTKYFYTSFGQSSAYVVDKKIFLEKAHQDPTIMAQIAHGLSEHYDVLLDRVNSVEQSDVRSKILLTLQSLCAKFAVSETVHLHEIGLNLTQQDIADMVGATREATSVELKKLQKEELITYSRSSFVVYVDKINRLVSSAG